MFGKLMKHEFRATRRFVPYIYLSALAATLALCVFTYQSREIPTLIAAAAVIVLVIACVIATFVMLVRRYVAGFFGREGYLTRALPASQAKLLGSRLLTSVLWMVASILVMGLCLVLLVLFARGGIWTTLPVGQSGNITLTFGYILEALERRGIGMGYFIFGVILPNVGLLLGALAEGLILLFFAIALSQTRFFARWNVGAAVVLVIALQIALQFLFDAVGNIAAFDASLFITAKGWMFADAARAYQAVHDHTLLAQIHLPTVLASVLLGIGGFWATQRLIGRSVSL